MEDICGRLADWAIDSSWKTLAAPAQVRIRELLIDTLACAFGGRPHPAVAQAAKVASNLTSSQSTDRHATGLGSGRRLSTMGAILDNGAAIRALDLNDFYWGPGLGGHPSDVFASAIAIAEEADSSIDECLAAAAVGYEFFTRLMDLMRAGDPPWAWDHTSACGPAAALIAGRLLKLDRETLAQALAISIARAPVFSGFRAGKISSAKAAAPAMAQMDGLLAVQLAMAGMTGPREVMAGPRGLEAIIVEGSDINHLIPKPDDPHRVLDITVKRFPCMGTGQATTATAVELHRKLAGRISDIAGILLHVSDSGIVRRQTADVYRRPDRRETADHSFYAIFGIALVDGHLEPSQFAARRWEDADVASVIDKLQLSPDLPGEAEGIFPARAHVTMKDGSTLDVDMPYAPGHRLNPLSEEQMCDKFRTFATPAIGASRVDGILKTCLDRSGKTTIRDLMKFCAESIS